MALVLMAVLGFFAPQMVKIFMSDPSVVENGALMLRLQLAGMVCMGVVLISTCTFQSAGQASGSVSPVRRADREWSLRLY